MELNETIKVSLITVQCNENVYDIISTSHQIEYKTACGKIHVDLLGKNNQNDIELRVKVNSIFRSLVEPGDPSQREGSIMRKNLIYLNTMMCDLPMSVTHSKSTEYIFVLDRSYSMFHDIKATCRCMSLLLKSIPVGSAFGFGDAYTKLFDRCVDYNETNMHIMAMTHLST